MAIKLTIAGEEVRFRVDSLDISNELNTRSRASFELYDPTGEYWPETGSVVIISEVVTVDDEPVEYKLFEGTLDEPEEHIPDGVKEGHFIKCRVVSYDQLCDRYHVAAVYVDKTCREIIQDALTSPNHCAIYQEGIDANEYVQDGPVIEKLVANYITVTDLLNDLSKLTGYKWYVDFDKKLHFFERTAVDAPFGLNDEVHNFAKPKLRRTREDYRNVQIVRGGTTTTDTRVELFAGDGKRRTFTLSYQVNEMQMVRIRRSGGPWQEQIVAVKGTEGAEWTYLKGSADISQTDSGTVLGINDELEVTYVGEFPVIAISPREDEIEHRKAIEGGGGIYERIEFDDSIENEEAAERKAESLLDSYAKIPRIFTFETMERGLEPGQAIPIKLARFNLDDTFLITRVDIKCMAGKHLKYSVRCVGSEYDTWVQYFRKMADRPKRMVIRENEKVLLMRSLRDRTSLADTEEHQESVVASYVGEETYIGFSEVEDFEYYFISPGQWIFGRVRAA